MFVPRLPSSTLPYIEGTGVCFLPLDTAPQLLASFKKMLHIKLAGSGNAQGIPCMSFWHTQHSELAGYTSCSHKQMHTKKVCMAQEVQLFWDCNGLIPPFVLRLAARQGPLRLVLFEA